MEETIMVNIVDNYIKSHDLANFMIEIIQKNIDYNINDINIIKCVEECIYDYNKNKQEIDNIDIMKFSFKIFKYLTTKKYLDNIKKVKIIISMYKSLYNIYNPLNKQNTINYVIKTQFLYKIIHDTIKDIIENKNDELFYNLIFEAYITDNRYIISNELYEKPKMDLLSNFKYEFMDLAIRYRLKKSVKLFLTFCIRMPSIDCGKKRNSI